MWIDIGVIVLLILRAVLFRPALPPQVDLTMDSSQGGEAEQQESSFVAMEQ